MLVEQFAAKFPKNVSFAWFINRDGEVFRDINGRKTIRFSEQGAAYFIKIHSGVGWQEIIKNLVQLKKPVLGAENEYLAIKKLDELGVDTMTLVGYAMQGWNPANLRSFVVTKALTDTVSLEDYCANWSSQPPTYSQKQILIRKVALIAKQLHENGVNHRDFYICHFLLENTAALSADTRLFLIDLHRVQIRNKVPQRWLIKDLAALYFSTMHIGLSKRDYWRFIKIYQGSTLRVCFERDAKFWRKVARKAKMLMA